MLGQHQVASIPERGAKTTFPGVEDRSYGQILKSGEDENPTKDAVEPNNIAPPSPSLSVPSTIGTDVSRRKADQDQVAFRQGCAREVKRQAQSRLPRRAEMKERVVQHTVSAEPVLSSVHSGCPVKRNKLQRRIRMPRS